MNENVNDLLKKITSYYTKLSIGFEMIAIFFLYSKYLFVYANRMNQVCRRKLECGKLFYLLQSTAKTLLS